MKSKLFLIIIFFGIIYSCEKNSDNNSEEQLESFVIIGDLNVDIITLDTLIYPSGRGDSILYQIDLDSDGLTDFRFYIYYNYSPCLFFSNFRFDCLNSLAKAYINDTILSPDILSLGDTLNNDKYWLSRSFEILNAGGVCESGGGDGIIHNDGNWFNISHKYIGLVIEKEDNPIYGWIKLSVPDDSWISSLLIHEIGCKKAAYNNK